MNFQDSVGREYQVLWIPSQYRSNTVQTAKITGKTRIAVTFRSPSKELGCEAATICLSQAHLTPFTRAGGIEARSGFYRSHCIKNNVSFSTHILSYKWVSCWFKCLAGAGMRSKSTPPCFWKIEDFP